MIFLALSILALLVSTQLRSRKYASLKHLAAVLFYVPLIAWIVSEAGLRALRGGESGLLGWFAIGLAISLIGQLLSNSGKALAKWASAAAPLAALSYALGFDVLRPDPYSYVPAAILAALILLVCARAYSRLAAGLKKKGSTTNRLLLMVCVFAIALVLYSALFKSIDRGWLLQWAYAAGAGGLLFAVSQLWLGWRLILKTSAIAEWQQVAVGRLGELLMVVSAFFVYREFL